VWDLAQWPGAASPVPAPLAGAAALGAIPRPLSPRERSYQDILSLGGASPRPPHAPHAPPRPTRPARTLTAARARGAAQGRRARPPSY
jgi:hypothetical protein